MKGHVILVLAPVAGIAALVIRSLRSERQLERRVAEQERQYNDLLDHAYELGLEAGVELYWLEALVHPPTPTNLTVEFNADLPPVARREAHSWASQIAFAKGRHDGWWEAADHDVVDQANSFTQERAA